MIALSDPGAKLPELGRGGATAGAGAVMQVPCAFAAVPHLGTGGPFAITTCKNGAFCDDFEEPSPAMRWTSAVTTVCAIDFPGPSSSLELQVLPLTVTPFGGYVEARAGSPSATPPPPRPASTRSRSTRTPCNA